VGVNGNARAAGDPNGEPASISDASPDASPRAVAAVPVPGPGAAGKGDVPTTAASGFAGLGSLASMRTPCRSSAASLSPRASGGDASSEEKEAPAGASTRRGAGGDTGGSHRGGIDAATPPPRSRSSESASRVGRDPPPSFLMPVTRFTSRPNFPIAERARDRHPRKPVLAIRSDAH